MNTDRNTFQLIQEGKKQGELFLSHAEAKEEYESQVITELNHVEEDQHVERGIRKFIEWISNGKLEIRAYPSSNLHAKLYIMTHETGKGSCIMSYGAITIDTNIFRNNGYQFHSGILGQLDQFKSTDIELIISEVMISEISKHLSEPLIKTLDSLKADIEKAQNKGLVSEVAYKAISDTLSGEKQPSQIVKERIDKFLEATEGTVVEAHDVEVTDVLKSYFDVKPPFEANEKKKCEFPDAIALLSLEKWAEENDTRILAVSSDGGWKKFAEQSRWIDVEDELATAIEILIEPEDLARNFVQKALAEMEAGQAPDTFNYLDTRLAEEVAEINAYAEASGDFHLIEEDGMEIVLKDFAFLKYDEETYAFHIVRQAEDEIVAEIAVSIEADISCNFNLSAWDGIDKEYIHITTAHAKTEETFEASILVTFSGQFLDHKYEITNVEITDAPSSFDFGHVQPDDSFYE